MKPALLAFAVLPLLGALSARADPKILTLEQALQLAREHQPDILSAKAKTAVAESKADQQFSSLLPQVSGSAAYSRTTANRAAQPGLTDLNATKSGGTWDTASFWNLGISASQLVWDFNATRGHYLASKLAAGATKDSEAAKVSDALLSVRTAFFGANAGKALVKVAEDSVASNRAHLAQTEGFVKAGARPEIDLYQNRADLAKAELELVNAKNNYDQAKAQLNQAMGIGPSADYDVADEALSPLQDEDAAEEALVQAAFDIRPELKSLTKQSQSQAKLIEATKGSLWPALGISTGFTDKGVDLHDMTWNWNAQATLSWSLFQGGLTRAQVREAEANLAAADAQLASERNQVRLEVAQARMAVIAAKASVEANAKIVENQKIRLRLAEGRYQAGVGSIIELQDAQVALTSAQGQAVQAGFNLSVARAKLLNALGRG
jgi:outer membrane protein